MTTPEQLRAERDRLALRRSAILAGANTHNRACSDHEYRELETCEARIQAIDQQLEHHDRDARYWRHTPPESQMATQPLYDGRVYDQAAGQPVDAPPARSGAPARAETGFARELRGLLASSLADGGILLPDPVRAEVWAALAVATPILTSGVTIIPMDSYQLTLPAVADLPAAGWLGEGREIPEAQPKFRAAKLSAKKVGAFAKISNELRGYGPAVAILARELERALSLAIDRALTRGSGTEWEPLGLLVDDRVPTLDLADPMSVVVTDLDFVVDAATAIRARGGTPNAVVLSPALWGRLQKLKEQTASVKSLLQPDVTAPAGERLYGMSVIVTAAIPSNLSYGSATDATEVLVGDMSQFVVGQAGMRVEPNEAYAFRTDETAVRAIALLDGAIMMPDAFQRVRGIRVGDA